MMRYRWVLVGVIAVLLSTGIAGAQEPTITPDVFATATAQIRNATRTAEADQQVTPDVATQEPFALTSTVIVRQITQTARAAGGTPDAATTEPRSEPDAFPLTATALLRDLTRTAAASDNTPVPVTTIPAAGGGDFVLTATAIVRQATQTAEAAGGDGNGGDGTNGAPTNCAFSAGLLLFIGLRLVRRAKQDVAA